MELPGLQRGETVVSFSFELKKHINGEETGDISSYVDHRMCQLRTNRLAGNKYFFRKLKIGSWAKTTMRECCDHFMLHAAVLTSFNRTYTAKSTPFEVFSHQSQLPEKKGKKPLKRSRSSNRLLTRFGKFLSFTSYLRFVTF